MARKSEDKKVKLITRGASDYIILIVVFLLLSIGLKHEEAHGSLRITLSIENNKEQIDFFINKLKEVIENLRKLSPLYEDFIKINQEIK